MCDYCEQVTYQNFAGKRFFTPLPSNFGGDNICLSINTYDRYAIHYENVHKTVSDVVSAPINFCPICGRDLTPEVD